MGAHGPTLRGRLYCQLRQVEFSLVPSNLGCGMLLLCLGCVLALEWHLHLFPGQARPEPVRPETSLMASP